MAWLHGRALTLVMLGLFMVSLFGQVLTGWHEHNNDLLDHGQAAMALSGYFATGHVSEPLDAYPRRFRDEPGVPWAVLGARCWLAYCDTAPMRIRRYSICPRSPSRPIGPLGGSANAASISVPLQVTVATPARTVTTSSFQSCGR